MANFDLKRLPVKVGCQLKTLLDGGFLDRKESLLLFDNPGAGKSRLIIATLFELRQPNFMQQSRKKAVPSLAQEMTWLWRGYDPARTSETFTQEPGEAAKPPFRVAIVNRDH